MKDGTIPLAEVPSQVLLAVLLQKLGGSYTFTDADMLNSLPPYFCIAAEFEEDGDVTKAITLSIVGSSESPPTGVDSE